MRGAQAQQHLERAAGKNDRMRLRKRLAQHPASNPTATQPQFRLEQHTNPTTAERWRVQKKRKEKKWKKKKKKKEEKKKVKYRRRSCLEKVSSKDRQLHQGEEERRRGMKERQSETSLGKI